MTISTELSRTDFMALTVTYMPLLCDVQHVPGCFLRHLSIYLTSPKNGGHIRK